MIERDEIFWYNKTKRSMSFGLFHLEICVLTFSICPPPYRLYILRTFSSLQKHYAYLNLPPKAFVLLYRARAPLAYPWISTLPTNLLFFILGILHHE